MINSLVCSRPLHFHEIRSIVEEIELAVTLFTVHCTANMKIDNVLKKKKKKKKNTHTHTRLRWIKKHNLSRFNHRLRF